MRVELTLPWPPSVNRYWRNVYGRTLISRVGRAYKTKIEWAVRLSNAPKIEGAIFLEIRLYCPDWVRRDIDNYLKALLDALDNAGLYSDDSQIVKLVVTKHSKVDAKGRVVVEAQTVSDGVTITPSGAWITTEES